MADKDLTTTGGSTASPDDGPLMAYRIVINVSYDLEASEVKVSSYSLEGFEMAGKDLFALMAQVPAEIEAWFNKHRGTEVLVMPVRPSLRIKERSIDDGYVAVPIRRLASALRNMRLASALRNMEPKP